MAVYLSAVNAFHETYPGICLEVTTDTRSLSLTKREADIALRVARLTQNDVAVRKVRELVYGVYASPSYLDRHGQPDVLAGATGHFAVLTDEDLMALPEMACFRLLTAKVRPVLRDNSRYAHRTAAAASIGLVCLARYLGDHSSASLSRRTCRRLCASCGWRFTTIRATHAAHPGADRVHHGGTQAAPRNAPSAGLTVAGVCRPSRSQAPKVIPSLRYISLISRRTRLISGDVSPL